MSGDIGLDQGLARDSLEDNATVLMFVSYLELKSGVLEIIKTKHFTKEGVDGKITSRAGECIDKITTENKLLTRQSRIATSFPTHDKIFNFVRHFPNSPQSCMVFQHQREKGSW